MCCQAGFSYSRSFGWYWTMIFVASTNDASTIERVAWPSLWSASYLPGSVIRLRAGPIFLCGFSPYVFAKQKASRSFKKLIFSPTLAILRSGLCSRRRCNNNHDIAYGCKGSRYMCRCLAYRPQRSKFRILPILSIHTDLA